MLESLTLLLVIYVAFSSFAGINATRILQPLFRSGLSIATAIFGLLVKLFVSLVSSVIGGSLSIKTSSDFRPNDKMPPRW